MLMIGKIIVSVLNEGILIFGANLKILESPCGCTIRIRLKSNVNKLIKTTACEGRWRGH